MKKWISLALAVLLTVSALPVSFSAAPQEPRIIETVYPTEDIVIADIVASEAPYHADATGGFTDEKKERRLTVRDGGILDGISDYERTVIKECIAQDPRPSYQNDGDRIYGVKIFSYDVKFKVNDGVAMIISV